MRTADGSPAALLGSPQQRTATPAIRKATRVAVSDATRAEVTRLLEQLRARVADHFGRSLDAVEEPQFLHYGRGDYFVAHQDGNTPLVHDESRFRKVSVVIFLSEQSDEPAPGTYRGGSLVIHGDPPMPLAPAPGTLLAFPAETTHEVKPVTDGERLSIVSWYRG